MTYQTRVAQGGPSVGRFVVSAMGRWVALLVHTTSVNARNTSNGWSASVVNTDPMTAMKFALEIEHSEKHCCAACRADRETMRNRPTVRLESTDGHTHIFLNGVDMSGIITSYTLSESAGEPAELTLVVPLIKQSVDLFSWAGTVDGVTIVTDESYSAD